ncbi:MAG: hypothetical protein Q8N26_28495, partial [Myxococcales bacterium]|nr:hypothetical protein [Myxococcales bacterium]
GGSAGGTSGGSAGGMSGGSAGGMSGGSADGGLSRPAGVLLQRVSIPDSPFGVAISSQGVIYVTTGTGRAYRGELATRTFAAPLALAGIAIDVAFTADEEVAVVAHQNSTAGPITLINPMTNTIEGTVPTSFGLGSIARDLAGNRTFFGMVNTPAVYELKRVRDGGFQGGPDGGLVAGFEGRVISSPVGGPNVAIAGVAWDPGRQRLYATSSAGSLGVITMPDGGTTPAIGLGGATGVRGAVYDAARDRLYIANETGGFFNLQLPTFAQVPGGAPSGAMSHWGAALTPDGAELWLTNSNAGVLTILTLSNNQVRTVSGLGRPRRIAFDATGRNAVIANENGEVLFFQ